MLQPRGHGLVDEPFAQPREIAEQRGKGGSRYGRAKSARPVAQEREGSLQGGAADQPNFPAVPE